jgi:hypothetical protein
MDLHKTAQASLTYADKHAVISSPVPDSSLLVDDEDSSLGQPTPSSNTEPHSVIQYLALLLIDLSGETVIRLPTASLKRHNVVLRPRRCSDWK